MTWHSHPVNGELAHQIGKHMRLRRTAGKDGHRFVFKDLRPAADGGGLYCLDGGEHVVLTHREDRTWQHYWRHPERGWELQEVYRGKMSAREAAENFTPPGGPPPPGPGVYVVAGWPGRNASMRVRISPEVGGRQLTEEAQGRIQEAIVATFARLVGEYGTVDREVIPV